MRQSTRSVNFPDRGTEQAFHNAAGEVIRTIDGAGMDVRLDIDALGRAWRRQSGRSSSATAPPPAGRIFADGFETPGLPVPGLVVDVWRYDTAGNGRGLLHWEERTEQGEDAYRRTMNYDTRGRPSNRATLIDASACTESWLYDTLGRMYRATDAAGGTLEQTWTTRGHPYQLRNAAQPAEIYQQITAQNARGQITDELRGAATMTRSFHAQRGWLTGITATASTTFQNLAYQHDALGNLEQRRDLRGNQTEDFTYDGLNRLKTARVKVGVTSPVTVLDLTYDTLGNICSKNVAAYTYASRDGCNATGTTATASPHAVTQIGSQTFVYGANGALEHDSGSGGAPERWFGYDGLQNLSLVLVGSLITPTAELKLRYGPSGERYRRTERIGGDQSRSVWNGDCMRRPGHAACRDGNSLHAGSGPDHTLGRHRAIPVPHGSRLVRFSALAAGVCQERCPLFHAACAAGLGRFSAGLSGLRQTTSTGFQLRVGRVRQRSGLFALACS